MDERLKCLLERNPPSEPRKNEVRTAGLIDSAKILHSFAFRRLQGKRQVLGIDQGDFHRTRLTHSSEVASISRTIAEVFIRDEEQKHKKNWNINIKDPQFKLLSEYILDGKEKNFLDSLRAISMAHDIGHPPFGHAGEAVLNYLMREHGGFEGNAQNIRLITTIDKFQLSRQTLLGIIKYPLKLNIVPPNSQQQACQPTIFNYYVGIEKFNKIIEQNGSITKGFYSEDEKTVDWIFKFDKNEMDFDEFSKLFQQQSFYKTSERYKIKSFCCSIMDIADDISNAIHDLEDGISLKLISKEKLRDELKQQENQIINLFRHFDKQFSPLDLDQLVNAFFEGEKHEKKIILDFLFMH